jgi:nucleotidyltransferase/DNA polymerase involved in DNA repair
MLAAEETAEADVLAVPDGDEQVFLRNLPLERLPVSDSTLRRLLLFGISRIGEILTLPTGAIEAQFGKEGRRLIEFAQGIDDGRLEPWYDDSALSMERHFDVPVEYTGELLQSIEELVAALCSGLQSRWQCCRTTTIEVRFEDGTAVNRSVRFKQPVSSITAMNNRIAHCVEQFGDMAPVEDVRLTLTDLCAETGRQASFLDGPPRARDQLLEAVRTLQGRYGDTVVKKVVACRNGRLPEERFAFTSCDVDGS